MKQGKEVERLAMETKFKDKAASIWVGGSSMNDLMCLVDEILDFALSSGEEVTDKDSPDYKKLYEAAKKLIECVPIGAPFNNVFLAGFDEALREFQHLLNIEPNPERSVATKSNQGTGSPETN